MPTLTVRTTLLLSFSGALLTGCANLPQLFGDGLSPEGDAVEVMQLFGRGVQQFQCTKDKDGRYWKFIAPKVSLTDDKGREVLVQGADFIFTSHDGSVLTSKIVKWEKKSGDRENVRSVLFETVGHGKTGVLTGVRWVKRTEGKGGLPLTTCSASQYGTFLQVPFTARYTFYR